MEPRLKCNEIYETLNRIIRRLDKNDEINVVDINVCIDSEANKMPRKQNKELNLYMNHK